jgi:tRNA A-37 threonylcarbamoyl transferase component Bud32
VYDEFELQNPRHELSHEFESPEEVLEYQLKERYLPEAAALKCIEYHNSANPGNKINAPRLFDCGQLEMVLDDSNNCIWRILARGCFLLEEYVQDFGDFAFTQSSVTAGLEQIERLSQLGICHLDIRRSNTRVQSDGTIFLIDYSLMSNCMILKTWRSAAAVLSP